MLLTHAIGSSCSVPGIFPPITVQVAGALLEQSRLAREVAQLRAAGCRVELIIPDDETVVVFGPSLMDTTRRMEAARAGLR